MTNTSFRKKTLLASVAMLLVAMLALSSATFAWFATANTATASGISVKSTASRGLAVRSESVAAITTNTPDFAATTYLNCNDDGTATSTDALVLSPASYCFATGDNLGKFYTTVSDSRGSAIPTTGTTINQVTTVDYHATNGVYGEKIYVKVLGESGASATVNVSVSITSTASSSNDPLLNAIRVLVVDSENTVKYFGCPGSFTANRYITADTANYSTAMTSGSTTQAAVTTAQSIGTITTTGNQYVTLYVYLDGEDTNCYSSNVTLTDLIDSISVNFTIAA